MYIYIHTCVYIHGETTLDTQRGRATSGHRCSNAGCAPIEPHGIWGNIDPAAPAREPVPKLSEILNADVSLRYHAFHSERSAKWSDCNDSHGGCWCCYMLLRVQSSDCFFHGEIPARSGHTQVRKQRLAGRTGNMTEDKAHGIPDEQLKTNVIECLKA